MRSRPLPLVLLVWLLVLGGLCSDGLAQVSGVRLEVPPDFVGLGGVLRPGSWTPMRLSLVNESAENRAVRCQWLLRDADGDEVVAERLVTLTSGREQYAYLYAVPPTGAREGDTYTVRVLDAGTGQPLAAAEALPAVWVPARQGVVGLMSSAPVGLEPYTAQYTQHEAIGLVRGLTLEALPDRWYGLDLLHSLVWTQEGGDPSAPAVTTAQHQALREWVRRGGHLVVVLPEVGEPWSGSPLADLLPVGAGQMRRVQEPPPRFLIEAIPEERIELAMTVFDDVEEGGATVLYRTDGGDPVVVAKRFGFGRVTLMGIDLTDSRLRALGAPAGQYRIWNGVFGWNSPVLTHAAAEGLRREGKMNFPNTRANIDLGAFAPQAIAMTGEAAPALLAAILIFLLYWLAAGPVGFALLRKKGLERHAWLAFTAVVLVFTAVAWGGAALMRPASDRIAHVSVVDYDGQAGPVRVQSWFSLFVPTFVPVDVALGDDDAAAGNTLWSPGLFAGTDDRGYLDPQTYTVDAAAPSDMEDLPTRATSKQFASQYLGPLNETLPGVTAGWVPPQGRVAVDATGFPAGTLAHGLPGTLRNVLIIYVTPRSSVERYPRPWVWRLGDWPAREPLAIGPDLFRTLDRDWLVVRPPDNYEGPRRFQAEGFLGRLIGEGKTGLLLAQDGQGGAGGSGVPGGEGTIPADQRVRLAEMLSFYDALPPPDFRSTDFTSQPVAYQRSIGRDLDLTPLTAGRRLIIIGHLDQSPLPLPFTVDGEAVPSEGWTIVRWVQEL